MALWGTIKIGLIRNQRSILEMAIHTEKSDSSLIQNGAVFV